MGAWSNAVLNAKANQIEATIGASPTLEIRTGAEPASPASADTGTLLVTMTLPADWLTAASAGVVTKNGTWTGTGAATGTAGHYRIKAGATCHRQGNVTVTGGGGELQVVNTSIAIGQTVEVTAFSSTES